MKKTITGKVTAILDQAHQKQVAIETAPAVQPKNSEPGTPAKTFNLTTNDHDLLELLSKRGTQVTITIETK